MYDSKYLNDNTKLPVTILDEIDSTNEEAKRRIANGEKDDFVLVARKQTAGKGRKGRSFFSPMDTGIYLTYTHFTSESVEESLRTTIATSVIVKNAIKSVTGFDCGIKWVNDLYLNGKKVCGILCECILKNTYDNEKNALIIGIGINLTTSDYPDDILDKAGSIFEGSSNDVDDICNKDIKNDIVINIVNGLEEFFSKDNYNFIDEYKKSSLVLEKSVELSDASGVFAKGLVKNILDDGALLLLDDKNNKTIIDSGEISLIVV